MGLSRLDNFLKSVRGTILYVDPNSIDSTDSIENQGNSLTRPFKTIQRALIEAARFSYQRGLDNDRFGKTTILLYPGDHIVDNRPGWIPFQSNNYLLRSGATSNVFPPFDLTSNFDLTSQDNQLYKLNSIHGGVIIPRGTSIVGLDLRKTKIRPLYVPNPENNNIKRSAIFRVTGSCYFWQFTFLDADPNGICYKDYTTNTFVPNFSHHKLTAFEYADGVNPVNIQDDFLTHYAERTDLDMYYEKIGLAYGQATGREVQPDFPVAGINIQSKVDEYRIVGSRGAEVGISSIRAGDGVTATTTITVDLEEVLPGLDVDTPIRIEGVGVSGYDGQFVISEVNSPTQILYKVQNPPLQALPSLTNATLNITIDTVTSASPYIFNCSLRSVYGMCGMLADGSKADGFKSMIVAQFTGVSLQKDNRAFIKYNSSSGTYEDFTAFGNENIQSDSRAVYKPSYENFHIKCQNDAYIQAVSVFAIGYAGQFVVDTGGDQSINNSNSNFGAKALVAKGFRNSAFSRDDVGYITHVIPPKFLETTEVNVEYDSIDVSKTVSVGNTSRLYLYNQNNQGVSPEGVIEGYRLGAKINDTLNVLINQGGSATEYSSKIVMPSSENTASEKKFIVGRSTVGINSIASNTITFTKYHTFENGETVRVISNTGQLPDGLEPNQTYYAITSGVGTDRIKLAKTLNDAISLNALTINSKGGVLNVISRVSDKKPGDYGHPIQYDTTNSQWYVNVSSASTENTIYPTIVGLGTTVLGSATPRTYIKRNPDTRSVIDTAYRLRYVIPADSTLSGRIPIEGYVIQESNSSIGSLNAEVGYQFHPTGATLSNSTQLRNPRIIANASWSSGTARIVTELPHDLQVGSTVEIVNIKSTNNTAGIANTAYNGTFSVSGISSAKQFTVSIPNNPGTFTNDTSTRTTSLPYFRKKQFKNTYIVYKSQEIQKYIPGERDGIYHLIVVNASNSPSISPFENEKFLQPIQNLYPQTNRDNPNSDPKASVSFALPSTIGQVVINEPQNSITKETLEKKLVDTSVGFGITNIVSVSAGTAHTFFTTIDHGLNQVTKVNIINGGSGYGVGSANTEYYYNARLVGYAGSTTGQNATARVTVSAAGTISNVLIMDGGSAYGIGNTMTIVGIATTTSFSEATVQVSTINSNIGDVLSLSGIILDEYEQYNNLYKITGISSSKEVVVSSASTVGSSAISGIGITAASFANVTLTGKCLDVSSISYNRITGLATVTTVQGHGLNINNAVRFDGADNKFYNGIFLVKEVVGLSTFITNFGISTTTQSTSGTISVYPPGFVAAGGNVTAENENLGGRLSAQYAGITTTISSAITDENVSTINISNVGDYNFQIGDYLQIDEEILRIKSTVTSNPVSVFRGLLGTRKTTHVNGSVIRRIKPQPIELRRNSLIRASAHTFEYLGFGPGNYSTAFPDKQDRSITPQQELLAQATKKDGGVVVFTGMNADGNFYVGNKKVNSTTGEEETFDTPIPTVVGEDPGVGLNFGFNVINPLEISVDRSIRVNGGADNNIISKFDGPVVFNNKIISTSNKGIEANSIFLQGSETVSRKYTVGISTPILAGNPGDVQYNANPASDDYVGWVYTNNNQWEKFGYIGAFEDARVGVSSGGNFVGISTLINFVAGVGATVSTAYSSTSGITTVTFQATPLQIGVSTGLGLNKVFSGIATELNFVGYGVSITAVQNAGIASITFDASVGGSGSPGAPLNSIQYNNNGFFAGSSNLVFDGTNLIVANAIGINNPLPIAKLDIISSTTEALHIRSTSGSGNIVTVDNVNTDTTPFIIDVNGNVGINTLTANAALDVAGNVAVVGSLRLYETDRTNYVGLQAPILGTNYTLTLPTTVGAASSILRTTGSGVLDWVSPSSIVAGIVTNTDNLAEGSTNLYFTQERAQDSIAAAINAGIQTGINVTYDDANNRINFNNTASTPYPFTTRGFSIPI
jgi:hypothetical protein